MTNRPQSQRNSDAPGCLLLGGAGLASILFGIMTIGSFFPELVRTCFEVSLIGLVSSAVLAGILAAIQDAKLRSEGNWKLKGENLDSRGESLGVTRMYAEPDTRYRARIGAVLKADIAHRQGRP